MQSVLYLFLSFQFISFSYIIQGPYLSGYAMLTIRHLCLKYEPSRTLMKETLC